MANSESMAARALVVTSPGAGLSLVDVEVDVPRACEVRVRTAAAGLCHSDLPFIDGGRAHSFPFVPGHEASGIVEAVGEGVKDLRTGDHVVLCPATSCGHCLPCSTGQPWLCADRASLERTPGDTPRLSWKGAEVHQFRGLSTFADLVLVHESAVTRIDDDLPLDLAAPLGCAVVTGAGSVCHQDLRPRSTIAVIGCGGIGLNVIRAAVLTGAARVVAVDLHHAALRLAQRFGATDLVDAAAQDVVARVRDLVPGGVDYAYEVVGQARTLRQAFEMLAVGGTAFVVGVPRDGVEVSLPMGGLLLDRSVKGLYLGSTRPGTDILRYAAWHRSGDLDLAALVSRRISLEDVESAYAELEAGSAARCVVAFPPAPAGPLTRT